jgi:PhoH-like ATPase
MYKVLDTNILLLDAHNLITLGKDGSIIVLPETVLDELDAKKNDIGEIGYQAREFGRLLTRANKVHIIENDNITITRLSLDGTEIEVVSLLSYPDMSDLSPKVVNDRKIIEVALQYHNTKGNVLFLSNDVMCRIRAESLGLKASDIRDIEEKNIVFTKELKVDAETFRTLHKRPVAEIDSEYRPNYYNYKITCNYTSQVKLATVSNGQIEVLGKETEKELRLQDINPINAEQLFMSKAIQDPTIDIVIVESLSGSGKTAVAISNAIRLVKRHQYEGILYIRASIDDVDQVEAVGFLPGLEEKFSVYLHPLKDTLDFIVRNNMKGTKLKGQQLEEKVESLIEETISKCNIQTLTGLGMRGRTFNNTVILLDESQNQSNASMQKMLTRFGKGCKIIILGSNRQIDNPYLTKYTNGLSVILDACTRTHDNIKLHAVTLEKVVRGPIAEWAEVLFSKDNK